MAGADWFLPVVSAVAASGTLTMGLVQLGEYLRKKRSGEPAGTGPITDSTSTNAVLRTSYLTLESSLETERKRVTFLEERNAELHQQLIEQHQKYDAQLRDWEVRVNQLTDELAAMRRELHDESKDAP